MRKTAIALAALALCAPPLRGQVPEGAPLTHDNVLYTTPVWSRGDPFALLYLASRTNDIDSVAALGPRVTALEDALDGGTNNWNTAFGWGNHAGLYRVIGWVPSWTDVTGKPDLFDWSWDSLTNLPTAFPPSTHTHALDDVLAAGNVAGRGLSITNEYGYTLFDIASDSGDVKISGIFSSFFGFELTSYGRYNYDGYLDYSDFTTYFCPWSLSWGEVPNDRRIALVSQIPTDFVTNETDDIALAALAAHAAYWPSSATPSSWFTFTTNSGAITITGYDIGGGADVVIPEYIGGWPVTVIGDNAFSPDYGGMAITSVSSPQATTIGDYAFGNCGGLTSISLPQATTIGVNAFGNCGKLTSISLPQATTIGDSAFGNCAVLTSVSLPQVTTIGEYAFDSCDDLTSVSLPQATAVGDYAFAYCSGLASVSLPQATTIGDGIFSEIPANQVTNYVTNPQATGWGAKLGGMPVVRLPLYGDEIYRAGQPVATEAHVAQAIAAIPEPDLSGKVDVAGGVATNLWLQGETIVSDSYTNLWWRNVISNGWHWLVAYTNAPAGGGE